MPKFESGEVSFDVPRHWVDRSVVAFVAPQKAGRDAVANIVMTRDALREGEVLGAYTDRQITQLAAKLDGFSLLSRSERAVGGHAAIEIRFRARGARGALAQRMLIAAVKKAVFSFTSTTPEEDAAQNDPLFDRVFSSIALREAAVEDEGP